MTPQTFARELAPARTFGFASEVEALKAKGLIKGASTASAIVLDERGLADGGNIALARALARAAQRTAPPAMDIGRIMDVLPHRYPLLLVDRIVEVEGQERIVGIKNVTINEPFFQGHFPGHPIMPGVLIIEAMAQVGGMLLMSHFEGQNVEDKVVYFMSLDNVKFRRPVVPGDQIRFELDMLQFRGKTCRMKGVGYVDGQVVAEAEMMAMVTDK